MVANREFLDDKDQESRDQASGDKNGDLGNADPMDLAMVQMFIQGKRPLPR